VPNHKWLPACAGMTGFFVMYSLINPLRKKTIGRNFTGIVTN